MVFEKKKKDWKELREAGNSIKTNVSKYCSSRIESVSALGKIGPSKLVGLFPLSVISLIRP